jgi:ribosomal protein L11
MKKVNVDLMLGKKTESHFRHYGPRTSIVAAEMPVEIAIKTSPYGLRFGKSGLNSTEICEKFNTKSTQDWLKGLKLPVAFLVSATKSYIMELKLPTIYTLFNVILNMATEANVKLELPERKVILLLISYKIAIIKSQSLQRYELEAWISQICGSNYSYDLYNPWRREKKGFNFKKKGKK